MASSGGPLAALSAQPPTPLGQAGGAGGTGAAAAARPAGGAAGTAGNDQSAAGGAGSAFGARSGDAAQANIRITPDVTNNSILVYASQETQHIVEQTLRQIDRPLMQVAIDATVAEVTLNDALTYGVQYFLNSRDPGSQNRRLGHQHDRRGGGASGRRVSGLNFVLGPASMPNVVLDALHSVTDVKVLSNPSLVVLDNQAATLQVGDQVPI